MNGTAYTEYVARVRENVRGGMEKTAAIDEALDWATGQKLLDGFFRERKSEVKAMSITEFDLDEFVENRRAEGMVEGWQKGKAEGKQEERFNMIVALDRQNVPRKAIAAAAGLSEAEIERIIEGAMANA